MSKFLIEILIPTFNREEFLIKNLRLLLEQIQKDNLFNRICISISDNASADNTESAVAEFKQNHPSIQINYSRNESNIGLEPNAVSVLKKAKTPYILWLGDDDYLAEGYLSFLLREIDDNGKLGCVIPGLSALFEDGSTETRREKSTGLYKKVAGYSAMYEWSHLAHQMSGILIFREGIYEKYMSNYNHRNPYLFIFQAADRLLHFDSIYAPKYSTLISEFNAKDWGYNEVGLLDEVFKSYYPFINELGEENVGELLLRFSVLHSYRYGIQFMRPFKLLKQYQSLLKSTPKLKGFKQSIRKHLIKDYLLSFAK
ncbi:MAG: glycosyltransferase family 2 protein [Reichenbachiella sp.]